MQAEIPNYRAAGRTAACARINSSLIWLPAVALLLQLSAAAAQEAAEQEAAGTDKAEMPVVDTSNWRCKFCEFEEGWYSDFTLGIGYVSDDSFKFGEYNGLHEKGTHLIADGNARYRSEDAMYLDLSLSDLGLDSRSLGIEGGRQGRYDLYLRYDEIPHFVSDSGSTPYLGSGGDRLTLPAGWVTAGGTPNMTALDASLRGIDIETERKRLGAGIKITTESPWSFRVDVRRDDKQGSKRGGGAFSFSSAQFVEPVDYVTDEIDAAVFYSRKGLQASLDYYASMFSNDNESLRWENAYNPIVAGADEGQLALPPDNEFQQLTLGAAYAFNASNHLNAEIAVGHMEQNEKLLQATVNPLLVPALPADSANAEIDTTNARLRFTSALTDRLKLSARYLYDDRDNKTEQMLYDWVTTDAFPATQRANLPYSYTRSSLRLQTDYDNTRGIRLGVGVERDERERTFQEVDQTDEDTLWGTIRVRNIDSLYLEFKLAFSEREASAYEVVAEIDPPQNVLMRKYNMADRERQLASVSVDFMPRPDYSLGISLQTARDQYDDSELGLNDSRDHSLDLDLTAMLSEETSISVFAGRQKIDSEQSGSQLFGTPDWLASNEDTFDFFGFGVTHVLVADTLSIGVDYSNARSRGEIELDGGAPFPDLRSELESIRLYLNYRLDENLSLQAAYWHETYDADDWALDGVDPDTVSNLLAFGEDSASYRNDVFKISMNYRF